MVVWCLSLLTSTHDDKNIIYVYEYEEYCGMRIIHTFGSLKIPASFTSLSTRSVSYRIGSHCNFSLVALGSFLRVRYHSILIPSYKGTTLVRNSVRTSCVPACSTRIRHGRLTLKVWYVGMEWCVVVIIAYISVAIRLIQPEHVRTTFY